MNSLFHRTKRLIKRRKEAQRFGIGFLLARNFEVPRSILVNGRGTTLNVPQEHGVRSDFISIFLDDCYGLYKTSMQSPVILDIGANVGLFALASRVAFPDAIIHAYEPNAQLETYLSKQAEAGAFTYFMEAVGLQEGFVELEFLGDSNLTRSKIASNGIVHQSSFRQAIERAGGQVDLAKIDCEGVEWQLFEDVESWTHIRNLAMEYHLWATVGRTHGDVRGIVQRLGFEVLEQEYTADDYGLLRARRIPDTSIVTSKC